MIGQLFVSSIKLFDGFGSLGYKGRDLMQKKKKRGSREIVGAHKISESFLYLG